jgi:Electron transfer DM13
VFVLLYFAPQALFINNRIDEPIPSAVSTSQPAASAAAQPGPLQLLSGDFRSLEHRTTGTAAVLRLPDGTALLRLENFSTSNGPDVHVYLSAAPADGPADAFGRNPIELGSLKANQGNINYAIPAGTNLQSIKSAVIWCRRFSVGFGVAPLLPAG